MLFSKHILVGTDFSESSEPALMTAHEMAQKYGSKVTLFHAFDPTPPVAPIAIPNTALVDEKIAQEMHQIIEKNLQKIKEEKFSEIHDVHVEVCRHPNPSSAMTEYAEQNDVDLIIVASHGRTGFKRMLIGSVAESTVRHAPCSVLVVR